MLRIGIRLSRSSSGGRGWQLRCLSPRRCARELETRSLTQRCICWRALGEQAGAGASGAWKGPLIQAKAKATASAFTGVWAAAQPSAKLGGSAPMNMHSTKIPSMDFVSRKENVSVYCPPRPMVAGRILGLGSCQALETSVQGKIWKNFCTCLLVMSIGTDSRCLVCVPGYQNLGPLGSVFSDRHLLLLGRLVLPLQVYEIGSRL